MKVHTLVDTLNGIDPLTLPYAYGGPDSCAGRMLRNFAKDVVRAHKFDMGNADCVASQELVLTGQEGIVSGAIRLPFPASYFEFDIPDHQETYGVLALEQVIDDRYVVGVHTFIYKDIPELKGWIDVGVFCLVSNPTTPDDYLYRLYPTAEAEDFIDYRNAQEVAFAGTKMLLGALALLNARGVTTEHVPEPTKLNRAKAKRGRCPVFEYRVVRITGMQASRPVPGDGTDVRAPPRLHWRRGHARTLPGGARTFVRAALVGDASRGVVAKHYQR